MTQETAASAMLYALQECVARINQLAESANTHKMARGLGRAVHAEDYTDVALAAIAKAQAAGIAPKR